MKLTKRKILLVVILLLLVVVISIAGRWCYRRYFSAAIEPSRIEYPERGLDLSSHNGKINFKAVKEAGYSFVILKASEGTSFIDKSFRDNIILAREAGLKVGVYHFFRFDCDGRLQANHFLNTIRGYEFDFPLVLDIEESGNPSGHDREDIIKSIQEALEHIQLHDYNVMIYTNKSGYRKLIESNFPDYQLWICSFSDPPGFPINGIYGNTHTAGRYQA